MNTKITNCRTKYTFIILNIAYVLGRSDLNCRRCVLYHCPPPPIKKIMTTVIWCPRFTEIFRIQSGIRWIRYKLGFPGAGSYYLSNKDRKYSEQCSLFRLKRSRQILLYLPSIWKNIFLLTTKIARQDPEFDHAGSVINLLPGSGSNYKFVIKILRIRGSGSGRNI